MRPPPHFTRAALIAEKDEEEKKYCRHVVRVGIDPLHQLAAVMEEIQSVQYQGDVCGRCINYDPNTKMYREIGRWCSRSIPAA